MKYVTPRADYPVRVRRRSIEVPESVALLYTGVYDVNLNQAVGIVFVPDLSSVAPPFDVDAVPDDLDEIGNVEQARLIAVLSSRYAVTPHARLAGQSHAYDGLSGDRTLVFYVPPADFERYAAELDELADLLSAFYPPGTVADIRDRAVVRFWESAILGSPEFAAQDAAILGLG
jgi:hypothetical protein